MQGAVPVVCAPMTGGQRSVAFMIACWLCAGCDLTPFAAETTALACRDGRENDGDRRLDCADPDCWGHEHCRIRGTDAGAPFVPAPPTEVPMEPGIVDHPPPSAATDGSVEPQPTLDASIELDASIADADVDAMQPPPPCEGCPEGSCTDGVCAPSGPLGVYRVVSLDVVVPTSERAEFGTCYDPASACNDVFRCCEPDPIVKVRVDGTEIGFVYTNDKSRKTWPDPNLELQLNNGSTVEFELSDDDSADEVISRDDEPDYIFTCSAIADSENVRAGVLGCVPDAEFPAPPGSGNPVGVIARFVMKGPPP